MTAAAGLYLASGLVILAHATLQVHLWRASVRAGRRTGRGARTGPPAPVAPIAVDAAPFVVVQLPIFNEPGVVLRLLDAVAGLRYPAGRWMVQVLDDSTDETPLLVGGWLAANSRALPTGFDHVRRHERTGFKAGALAGGLARVPHADLVAVLDADFVPEADFLELAVPEFLVDDVAVVQGRWRHLNADASWITRAQEVMLDNHFGVEQVGRQALGVFGAFNGSAGLLRASAIRVVGGWRATTLTEDFDLSVRLQLAGWRVVYLHHLAVPAELPASPSSLRVQQHRWMRGVAQNARLHRRSPWAPGLSAQSRVHLFGQLAETAAFAAMGAQLALAAPVALGVAASRVPALLGANLPLALGFLALAPVYFHSLRPSVPSVLGRARRYAGFVLLSSAMTLPNAVAVTLGWVTGGAEFERTPKAGDSTSAPKAPRATHRGRLIAEGALAAAVVTGAAALLATDRSAAAYLWPVLGWALGAMALEVTAAGERVRNQGRGAGASSVK